MKLAVIFFLCLVPVRLDTVGIGTPEKYVSFPSDATRVEQGIQKHLLAKQHEIDPVHTFDPGVHPAFVRGPVLSSWDGTTFPIQPNNHETRREKPYAVIPNNGVSTPYLKRLVGLLSHRQGRKQKSELN
jgi:hypothetical protein